MQYLIVGDLQAKRENLDTVRELLIQIEEFGQPIIWLGDLLDRRGLIEAEVLNILYSYLSRSKLRHYIIVGNHDLINMHGEETALEPLKALKNVWIIDQPTLLHPQSKVLLVPYRRSPNRFLEDISKLKNIDFIIGHQGVREFTAGSGYTEDEAVNLEDLKKFKQVIMGHYHSPMEKGNVVFLGSPFSHSFSEANETKRLGYFTDDCGLISYIETDFPKHMSFEINCDDPEYITFDQYLSSDNHYRIILKGKSETIAKFPKDKYPNVKFIEQPDNEEFKSEVNETQNHDDMFKTWLTSIKKEDSLDIEQIGLKILRESK